MKRVLILLLFLLPASLTWLSCGGYGNSSGSGKGSGLKYRAFVTNSVTSGNGAAGIYIVNAVADVRANTAAISSGNTPGMMVVTPNRAQTLVFSGTGTLASDNQLSLINNASEQNAAHVSFGAGSQGMTESIVVSPDSSTAYVALPNAQVSGPNPGIVEVIALSNGTANGQVEVPSVHYLSINNSGNRIFGFSDNSDFIAVITPSQIGIGNAVSYIGGPGIFDRPVAAFFTSDDSTAYVVNCGAECGGTQASVQKVDLTGTQCLPTGLCATAQVPAATVALVSNSTMYLAGTPFAGGLPSQPCTGQTTAATTCGLLTVFDLSSMTLATTAVITDGYHNRMALGANGQLFIGAHACTEIYAPVPPPAGAEVRGCLSIYNTLTTAVGSVPAGGVLIPPTNGDATGFQPIAKRTVVYACQGGSLYIYDVTKDALENNPNDPNNPGQINGLVGQFIDVKTVDF